MGNTVTIPLRNQRISGGTSPAATHLPFSAKTDFETQEKQTDKNFCQQNTITRDQ
ncbi:hypothetical protein ApDm4_1514 [Acetobacter pomorum]|nr:hypothetical protein ApDm4_1514 [Acetobacter pomorum]